MKLSLKLLETNTEIFSLILDNLKDQLNIVFNKAIPKIKTEIQEVIKNALINEPEYTSLKSGTLRAEFGIENPENVDKVIEALVQTIDITMDPILATQSSLRGGFKITMIKKDDINGVIYTDIASVITEKGELLPWLEWLLLKGNETIIQNYSVRYTTSSRSRSGMAIMVDSDRNWRVPPNFTGSQNNNWTTRAIDRVETQILTIIQNNIEASL